MSRTNDWKLTLLGIAFLAGAGTGHAKVVILDAPGRAPAADTPGVLTRLSTQPDNPAGYPLSTPWRLGLDRSYGILLPAANEHHSNKDGLTATRRGMESFRELSDQEERRLVSSRDGSSPSRYNEERDTTGAGLALLIMGGLAAYQLRRKQQLLKHLPFSP